MFDNLSERLDGVLRKLRGRGKLNEKNIKDALREVRLALLEADVNYKVVKDFIKNIEQRAIGEEVLKSLTPGQQVIKIVRDELTMLMGEKHEKLRLSSMPPTKIMMVGLQGSGKTTTCGKLARQFKQDGKKPLLVAADIYRPAAIQQLKTVGSKVGVEVYTEENVKPPVIAQNAVDYAQREGFQVVIVDTAGRLHIDQALMEELREMKQLIEPNEVLFIADAMTGQDAVNVADSFNKQIELSGIILTKMDGDARGGAALSIKSVTGKPIKFIGVGEKLDLLEPFHPDRMAQRILGMGDILSIIDKAEAAFDEEQARKLEEKIRKQTFGLDDYLQQMQQLKKMGPLDQIVKMIPGMSGQLKNIKDIQIPEEELKIQEAIILSMTPQERRDHTIINGSRRKRIAAGSGTSVADVNRLLKQFVMVSKMMKMATKQSFFNKFTKGFPLS